MGAQAATQANERKGEYVRVSMGCMQASLEKVVGGNIREEVPNTTMSTPYLSTVANLRSGQ